MSQVHKQMPKNTPRVRSTVAQDPKEDTPVLGRKVLSPSPAFLFYSDHQSIDNTHLHCVHELILNLMITVLISSANTLIDTPKTDVLSAI